MTREAVVIASVPPSLPESALVDHAVGAKGGLRGCQQLALVEWKNAVPRSRDTAGFWWPESLVRRGRFSASTLEVRDSQCWLLLLSASVEVKHVEQIPEGGAVQGHIGIVVFHNRIGKIIPATSGQRLQAPIPFDELEN